MDFKWMRALGYFKRRIGVRSHLVYVVLCIICSLCVYLISEGLISMQNVSKESSLLRGSPTLQTATLVEASHDGFESQNIKLCVEKRKFVFIKCMKCATETMATVLRRFGYFRHLNFVVPMVKQKIWLGWPYLMTDYDYRPSSRSYDVLMEHSIYNKTISDNIMPNDTVYITIIREPFSHFKSSINYWHVLDVIGIESEDPFSEYVYNVEKYETIYKSPEKFKQRHCVPNNFSMTKNLQSHCLGMPLGFPPERGDITNDPEAVQRYIEQLDKDFHLVMLVEYFQESLVLFKRKMCWTFYDIVYKFVNYKKYPEFFKNRTSDEDIKAIHRRFSSIDYQLYDHFNKTFWKHVANQGPDFFLEVAEFKSVQAKLDTFCKEGHGEFTIADNQWSPGFNMTKRDCTDLFNRLHNRIKARYDEEEGALYNRTSQENPSKYVARC